MNSLKEMSGTKCSKCKHFYDLHFSLDGYHNYCSLEHCYLCNVHKCYDFKEGETPKGKIRGEWNE